MAKIGDIVKFKNSFAFEYFHIPAYFYAKEWIRKHANKYYEAWVRCTYPSKQELLETFKVVAKGEIDIIDMSQQVKTYRVALLKSFDGGFYLVNENILIVVQSIASWFD